MAKAAPPSDCDFSGFPLGLLLKSLPPEMVKGAMDLVIKRLDLNAEKLSLIIMRQISPDEIVGESEEAQVRGISRTTLRSMKERGDLPQVINGNVVNVKD